MAHSNLVLSSLVLSFSIGAFGAACNEATEDPVSPDSADVCEAEEAEELASYEPLALSAVEDVDRIGREYKRCIDRCEDRLRGCRRGHTDRERERKCRHRYDDCREECGRRHGHPH